MITYDEFRNVDVRVAKIIAVDEFPEATKPAFKLTLDFGAELGIKKSSAQLTSHYKRDEILGKLVLAVVNVPPRQIGPFVSEVLTLGVPDENGECILITPDQATADIGGRLY